MAITRLGKYAAHPHSWLAFLADAYFGRAPNDEWIGLRLQMAAALRDGDSAALDELYAIAKKMEIDNG